MVGISLYFALTLTVSIVLACSVLFPFSSSIKAKNIGVLITDHNVQETLSITDRAYLLTEGKIMLTGKPEDIAENEMAEMTSNILSDMPKGDALLLTLYYLEDNSVKEVSKIVGLNEANVKVRLYRARQLFKQLWIQQYQTVQF